MLSRLAFNVQIASSKSFLLWRRAAVNGNKLNGFLNGYQSDVSGVRWVSTTAVLKSNQETTKPEKKKDDEFVIKATFKEDLPENDHIHKLKQTVRDYGPVVIVFHVAISLVSLSICYAIISTGLPIEDWIGDIEVLQNMANVAATGSTFLLAYAIHKVFAPFRIVCTIACAPVIVRYLRSKGILKPMKVKNTKTAVKYR